MLFYCKGRSCDSCQLQARLRLLELDPGLFENPSFVLAMPDSEQFKRAVDVVLFSSRIRGMAHDLRHDAARHFDPLGETGEGAAQAVQGDVRKPGNGQSAIVGDARLGKPARGGGRAGEYPFISARQ